MAKTCATCCWWDKGGARIASADTNPQMRSDVGVCCADPPKLIPITQFRSEGVFPVTHASRFCGAWEPDTGDGGGGGERQGGGTVISFDRSAA